MSRGRRNACRIILPLSALFLAVLDLQTVAGAAGETISTVAGTGAAGDTGDGGPATNARVNLPRSVSATADGGFIFAEPSSNRVRRVGPGGIISTVAGTGSGGFSGDGGPATQAQLNSVHAASPTPDGGFLLADTFNNRIRKVSGRGIITTVAGTGTAGYNGDDRPATAAAINRPRGVEALADGGFLVSDSGNHRVRRVSPAGTISTIAGTGQAGSWGDGAPARNAALYLPFAASPTADGAVLVADTGNHRIRRISADGTITTVAGTGAAGYAGDGGPASLARLYYPHGVVAAPEGGFYVADTSNNRVRFVHATGTISTFAGDGIATFRGDGGPATSASLNAPKGVSVAAQGVLIADERNNRIRAASGGSPTTTTIAPTTTTTGPPATTTTTSVPRPTTTTTTTPTTTTPPPAETPQCAALRQRIAQTTDPATRQALESLYASYGCGPPVG